MTLTASTSTSVFGYDYDSLNQMTALSRNSQNLAKFVYDERGNIISERFINGTYTTYEYDGSNRLTVIKNYNAAGAVLNFYSYAYDANGNRISVTTATGTINYKYDELNRLTQETLLDGTTISYEYDAAGNRTKKTAGSTVTNYTYDNGNQLTNVNSQAYTYDANGNLTNNGAKTFVYNEVNQLIQVKDSSGTVIASFTYDDQGRRISMTALGETSKYHYSGDKVIYVTNGSNTIIAEFTYDSQGNPATMTYNSVMYYYHLDGHGNVTAMTDASGNTVAAYSYDAWGKILSQSGSMAAINPFRYAGYRYDEATGLYYLMARYYDPGVGRFISRDTFHGYEEEPQSLHQYAYCDNNPVMYVDPTGHAPSLSVFVSLHNAVLNQTRYLLKLKGKDTMTQISTYSSATSIVPNGFMDIFCLKTREVWEVKRNNTNGIRAGNNQLSKYTSSFVKKYGTQLSSAVRPSLGSSVFNGYINLQEGIYDVSASCSGALILYSFKVNANRATAAGYAVVAGALVFLKTNIRVLSLESL